LKRAGFGRHGLNGAWDFSLTFTYAMPTALAAASKPDSQAATSRRGRAYRRLHQSFEALEKQLGLKLETTKKPQPVVVIDPSKRSRPRIS